MGSKNKKKYQATRLAQKKPRLVKPDDYLRIGNIEFIRSGRFISARNNMSKEDFASFQEKSADSLPDICEEIDNIITAIVSIVSSLSPTEILKRAYWEMAYHNLNVESECEATTEGVTALRMIDYLQSIIVSVEPSRPYKEEVNESTWSNLKELVTKLFSHVSLSYQIARTSYSALNDKDFNPDLEEYYYKAQVYWCNIRGHRPLVHEIPHLLDILSPHNSIFIELYGINVKTFINELSKISFSLSMGIDALFRELDEFRKASLSKADEKLKSGDSFERDDLNRPGIAGDSIT